MLKKVGSCLYAHKTNVKELINRVTDDQDVIAMITIVDSTTENEWDYAVIKYDKEKHTMSLIKSDDWFTSNEPVVGDSWRFDLRELTHKRVVARKENPQIYHSKWMFMPDDYDEAWMTNAMNRTEQWNKIPNLDKKRIGNQNYWFKILDENNISR